MKFIETWQRCILSILKSGNTVDSKIQFINRKNEYLTNKATLSKMNWMKFIATWQRCILSILKFGKVANR